MASLIRHRSPLPTFTKTWSMLLFQEQWITHSLHIVTAMIIHPLQPFFMSTQTIIHWESALQRPFSVVEKLLIVVIQRRITTMPKSTLLVTTRYIVYHRVSNNIKLLSCNILPNNDNYCPIHTSSPLLVF